MTTPASNTDAFAAAIRELTELRDDEREMAREATARKWIESGATHRNYARGLTEAIAVLTRHQQQATR
ncbi:hypothetical protein [Luteolibacter sp. LG18]|uniref:hypothetical protein n=1 Tax=Luteolibacter sp. LG18 TaxID=2819286 RepID=UPI002B282CEF|nr:hypothetical protein llg_07240 [Luteolibacter sp. LG18]BCU79647.1 hypothetical protein llg_43620 [Luteolibacter sp. LG18]